MSVVLILLVASLCLALAFLGAFIWSVKNGQYDDDYTPSIRVLFEDRSTTESTDKSNILQAKNGITESSNHRKAPKA